LLGVTNSDLWLSGILGGVVLLTIFAFYKEFLVLSFDPVLAATLRLPVVFLQNLLLVLLAIVIVVSIQAVGVALVIAMLITPASSAYLLSKRLPSMMMLAATIGSVSAIVGLYASFYANLPSGPAIVLVETGVFILVFLFSPSRGAIRAWLNSRSTTA
jgi:ABC-type Mn2+/Zn2+ transport system permease subunit